MSQRSIELRGVAVNNLRNVDLDLPHRQLIVFCGGCASYVELHRNDRWRLVML